MMRSLLRRGLVLFAAALAMSVVASATASAAKPEFSGSFPNKFQYKGGSVSFANAKGGTTFQCLNSTGEGSLTSAKAGTIKFSFTGCETGGATWTSEGATRGEIRSAVLPIAPGYVKRAPKEIGIEVNHGAAEFAGWTVGGYTGGIRGPAIALAAPINTKTTTYTLTLSSKELGVQSPIQFEEGPQLKLEINILGGYWGEGALTTKGSLVFEKALELQA
jgi:hypothetical protein